MKRLGQVKTAAWAGALALALTLATRPLPADTANPYLVITNRNAFNLTDLPPPPPPPPSKPEPPKPASTVRLSGITTILSKARALFEIVEAPGKPVQKPIMLVGDKVGDIELVSIDVENKRVTILQAGVETNLVLEARKAAPARPGQRPGTAPGLRPGMPPGIRPPTPQTAATPPTGGSPLVISSGSGGASSGRGGVITMGGVGSTPTPAATAAKTTAPGQYTSSGRPAPYVASRISPTPSAAAPVTLYQRAPSASPGSSAATLRTIPSRTPRTQSLGSAAPVDADAKAAQQLLMLHLNEAANPGQAPPPPPIE
ncbi:MAG: hypothetical protein JXQ71_11880 [Verrucomicrobia bacterium]|nr:hypothetical protein [Verrucomicrobiota bacterium]